MKFTGKFVLDPHSPGTIVCARQEDLDRLEGLLSKSLCNISLYINSEDSLMFIRARLAM